MGIFEKSIPKYIVDPIDQQVVVRPEDVYVDDIFDPIFNARVKDAMRQKYGDGLYGVVGGYEELWKNTWTGREGILGPGMGLLSTFGRSMEKADDIVLGALTEGIKALSFQGATNPIENIFVNDHDYTGRGLLAATANIGSRLVGAEVDESDFGSAWTLPSLGLELSTDVGILGGTLARKLAPGADKLTAKQLFENLGKSDLKTTVGEMGQLMSKYDDLMTKVALDVSAPGLRPAFKSLKNRIAELTKHQSPNAWAEVTKNLHAVEDTSADPTVRREAQKQLQENETVQQLTTLFQESDEALAQLPEDIYETAVFEMGAEESTIDRLAAAMALDLEGMGEDVASQIRMTQLKENIKLRHQEYNKNLYKAFDESRKIAESPDLKWYPDSAKLIGVQNPTAVETDVVAAMDAVSRIVDELNDEYSDPIREMLEDAYAGNPSRFIDALVSKEWSDNIATNSQIIRAVEPRLTYLKSTSPYRVSPSLKSAVDSIGNDGVEYSYKKLQELNRASDPNVKKFKNIQELKQFFEHPEFEAALEEFIPAQKLSKQASSKMSASDVWAKEQAIARGRRRKFVNLMTAVYFPKKGISTFDYTKKLIELENFVARYANPNMLSDSTRFLKNLTVEEVADIKANPESLLSIKQFLTNKHLLHADEYGRTVDGAAAKFLLTGRLPKSYKGNASLSKAAVTKAKRLRKEYTAELEAMLKEIDRVRSTSRNASSFLDKVYSTVDDISQNYLQVLRDEVQHPLKSAVSDVSLDKPVGDGSNTLLDLLKSGADYTPYASKNSFKPGESEYYKASRAVSNYVRAAVPDDASVEDFVKVTRPLAPYLDMGYLSSVKPPKSAETDAIVDTFYKEIVPLVEKVAEDPAKGNTYLNIIFNTDVAKDSFKSVPDDVRSAILKLRNFFGAPLATSTYPEARIYRQLYRKAVPAVPTDTMTKVVPKRATKTVDNLSDFLKTPQLPSTIHTELNRVDIANFADGKLTTAASKFWERSKALLEDLHLTEFELNDILNTARTKGISELSPTQLNKYRAYAQRIDALLKDTPYDTYVRDAADWASDTGWRGVLKAIDSAGTRVPAESAARVKKLVSREMSQTSRLGTTKYPFRYSKEDLELVNSIREYLPQDIVDYWNPSHKQGLFHFDIPNEPKIYTYKLGEDIDLRPERYQVYRFLKESKGKVKLTNFKYIDYGTLYSTSGREALTELATRERLRMNYIVDTPAVFKNTAADVLSKPSTKEATESILQIPESIVSATPDTVAELTYDAPSVAESSVEQVVEKIVAEDSAKFNGDGEIPETPAVFGDDNDAFWSLKKQIARANAVSSINSFRKQRATTRTARAKDLLSRVFSLRGRHLTEGGRMADFRRFVILRQQPYGDIVQGKDFWNELRHSGMLGAVYAKGSKDADAVLDSLTHNANLLKEIIGRDVLRVVSEPLGDDKVKIYAQFVNNKKIVTWLNAAADKIEKANFETVTFSPPKAYTAEDLAFLNQPTMRELAALMDETQELAADQAKYLGFTFNPNEAYTKHAMLRTPDTADWFNQNFYTKTSSEDLDAIVNSISNLDRYRKADHGSFGTTVNTRRFRGDVWMMDNNNIHRFNYDPYEMVTSTLADGTFANLQFQSYVDLFMNDNFKIKSIFNSVDELKEVLYKKLDDGSESGNLRNLELCSTRLDANGKIIGLTKYDKLSDAGLAKALKDENCILVPTNAISHIDNLLKKDVRMSNKLWTFINKHFTIPFKFGVLSNPGFLLGNMGDAYLKLATTMSQKYGTTVTEETIRVAETIKRANGYREDFGTAFDVWRKVSKDNGIMLSPDATIPGIVAMSPKYNEQFLDWLAGRLTVTKTVQDAATGKIETIEIPIPCDISERAKNGASTWVLLQTAQMNSNKLREFADLAELEHATDFDMPTNLWDRITQGKGKYDKHKPSTWGLFMNNPAMRAMLDASGGVEDVIRTASILDDLEHGYTPEELGILARGEKFTKSDIDFRVKLDEAKNTMYNAQFDYERGSDFMEGVGKVVPFPVFFLKNFAYWMELFAENPQYVDNAIDIQEGLWSNRDEEHSKDTFAVEAKGRGAIPIGGETLPEWFKGFYKPSPLQSMFGAFNLLNDPIGNMQYRVNPLVSGGIAATAKAFPNELTTSLAPTEETKYRPYSTDMYERNVKASDPNFNPIKYTVHRMNPYERAMNSYMRIPHKVEEGEAQLSDFVPSVFQPDF